MPRLDEKAVDARFRELLGIWFIQEDGYIPQTSTSSFRAWIIGAANLIELVTGGRGLHHAQAQQVVEKLPETDLVPAVLYANMMGALRATADDRRHGLLADVRYADMAATFDDFLDYAEEFHKGGQLEGSAVLVSAVIEDTLRQIAERNAVTETMPSSGSTR